MTAPAPSGPSMPRDAGTPDDAYLDVVDLSGERHGFKSWEKALSFARGMGATADDRLDPILYPPEECAKCDRMNRPSREAVGPSGQWIHGLTSLPAGFAQTHIYRCAGCGHSRGATPRFEALVRIATPDINLMVQFARDVLSGREPDEDWLARIAELKRRGLLRHHGRSNQVIPAGMGGLLWAHCARVAAGELLAAPGEPRRPGRPYFVVFDSANRAHAFKDWDGAAAFARQAKAENPAAFSALAAPEDAVETWEGAHIGPDARERIERNGTALVTES